MITLSSTITEGVVLQYADDTTFIFSGPTTAQVAAALNYQIKLG